MKQITILCPDGVWRSQEEIDQLIRDGQLIATTGIWPEKP